MFTNMHIAKANATESKIEMELLFLSQHNQTTCLELIMSLDAEDRTAYLNQYVHKMAVLYPHTETADTTETVWLLAA